MDKELIMCIVMYVIIFLWIFICPVVVDSGEDKRKRSRTMAEFGEWIEIKTRPLTEEEKQECGDEAEWYEFIYDCELPDDRQEVLVQLHYGIALTTFYTDMGCYFENYEDEDDVLAWMPLPKEFVKEQK